jgi:hypothetical protein
MRKVFAIAFLLVAQYAFAGDDEFAVSKIPAALLKNANAVVRADEQRFEIKNAGHAVERNRYVITILNEKADKLAVFAEDYSKMRKISSIEGYLYDASGKQLSKMKTKDAMDLSGTSEGNLVDDVRYKQFSFAYRVYPYTVEYIWEMEYNSTLFFPAWYAQGDEMVSVESSSIEVTSPLDYTYRFKAFNYDGEPERKPDAKTKTDTWKVTNLAAYVKEPYSPSLHEFGTMVLFGPSEFRVDDYSGNMSSWQDFGKFVYALKKGRDVLPDDIRNKVQELIRDVPDPLSRIRTLYQFLQKNTRYISIQLGIGGWQPFDAKFVASKAYGDCKALTNYMYSLLKEASIPSYYALVRAGRNSPNIITDFPAQQFNHVILCVPLSPDTLWLECTNQSVPAGYLGDFTNDRPALLVSEQGGQLVMTKRYPPPGNLQARTIRAELADNATLSVKSLTNYSGLQMDNVHSLINSLSRDKIREYLQKVLDLPTYDITSFSYTEMKSSNPSINEELSLDVVNYASQTGKRLFIIPNIMNRWTTRLTADEDRRYEVVLNAGFQDIDSVTIQLPAGYTAESLPPETHIENAFGVYTSRAKFDGDKVIYYRRLLFNGGRFPAASYNELVKFYEQIYKADRARLVLVRNS